LPLMTKLAAEDRFVGEPAVVAALRGNLNKGRHALSGP